MKKSVIFKMICMVLAMSMLTVFPVFAENGEEEPTENMLTAAVDGEEMVFYLSKAKSASDGYESSYISFTEEGEPQYYMYLRIPLGAKAGTYSGKTGLDACYFSLSTKYHPETGKWGDSYKMVHYGSSGTADIGTYTLTIDHDLSWDNEEGCGNFEAEMEGCSQSTEGQAVCVTEGKFHYIREEVHPVVQAWQDGSLDSTTPGWTDPYQNSDAGLSGGTSSSSGSDTGIDDTCRTCGGTGWCKKCLGFGVIINSYDYKLYDCPRCQGSGECAVCYGTGRVR